ncbi:MAG: CocE/NonD family hydrolase [Gammaproteobacteria bacterium]|nr:CocE/NonD family hydrolase [Gammaproteobacteria bacterium]
MPVPLFCLATTGQNPTCLLMDGNTERCQVTEIEHCWVPMPDGVRLSARLWLPTRSPAPAIVEYIPYRKRDMVRARDERNHPVFAANGFACVRVDMRGSGDSEGIMRDMYGDEELDDVRHVLAWIAAQEWCNGRIGMMGTSWGGTSALQAAAAGTGLLSAVIAVCATDNRYADDIHHMGGCLLTDSIEWGATLPAILALPPAPASDPDGWRERWLERLEQIEFPLFHWIEHETRDSYWRHGSVCETPGTFDCPVLAIGGWADRYSNTVMNLLTDNPAIAWGIVGPWGHHYPDHGTPGPAIGFQQEALRWWDRWLRDTDNGVDTEPRLRVWCGDFQTPADFIGQRNGRWLELAHWPPEATGSSARLELRPGSGLTRVDRGYVELPGDLRVGLAAGDTGYFGRPGGLPLEQTSEDARSLVIDSEPLETARCLVGCAVIELRLRVDQLPAQLVVRINDVAPDGQVMRVVYRISNLALDVDDQPLAEGSAAGERRLLVRLPNAAHRFAPGHRIRVALSSSYWPLVWPSASNRGCEVDPDSLVLQLPLVADGREPDSSPFADSAVAPPFDAVSINTRIRRGLETEGPVIVNWWQQPLAMTVHPGAGLEFGAESSAEHRIDVDDPLSADSRFEHRLVAHYGQRRFETLGCARVRASRECFFVTGSLRVFEKGELIFSREWSRDIARSYG